MKQKKNNKKYSNSIGKYMITLTIKVKSNVFHRLKEKPKFP